MLEAVSRLLYCTNKLNLYYHVEGWVQQRLDSNFEKISFFNEKLWQRLFFIWKIPTTERHLLINNEISKESPKLHSTLLVFSMCWNQTSTKLTMTSASD